MAGRRRKTPEELEEFKRNAEEIASRLKGARQLCLGLSTRELDRLAGTSEGHASYVESGKGGTETTTLDKLAGALGLTLDYLVRGDGKAPTAESVSAAVDRSRRELSEENKTPPSDPSEAPTGTGG